jgi:hypothetical protein
MGSWLENCYKLDTIDFRDVSRLEKASSGFLRRSSKLKNIIINKNFKKSFKRQIVSIIPRIKFQIDE